MADRIYQIHSSDDANNKLHAYRDECNAIDGGFGDMPGTPFVRHNGRIVRMTLMPNKARRIHSSDDVINEVYVYLDEHNATGGGDGPLPGMPFRVQNGKIVAVTLPGLKDVVSRARSTR